MDFNAAFNRHDLRGTGSIDIEDVRELMRDLGIEPGAGPWLLDQFGARGGIIAYKEVLKMVIDLMASELVYKPNCMRGFRSLLSSLGSRNPSESSAR